MELLNNLDKVHTTEMGVDRIKRNIGVDVEDIVKYSIECHTYHRMAAWKTITCHFY